MSTELTVLEHQFEPLLSKFTEVLSVPGINLTAQRLVRSVMISVERTPKLLSCTRQSLFNAAMSAACLGLEVDGATGQAFLIPFANVAQLVIGYKGFNTLAARSGLTISGEVVRDGDAFDFDEGEGWVKHKKDLTKSGRRITAAWAKAAANGRPSVVKVLGIDEILAIKAKSPGGKKPDSPWNDAAIGFPAMAEKSAKRRLARSMPLNVMQLAARMEEAFEEQGRVSYITPTQGVVVEGEPAAPPQAAELVAPEIADTAELATLTHGQPNTSDRLLVYDKMLEAAAKKGMAALEEAWHEVPYAYQINLKSALERRHKPAALENAI